MNMDPIADMLTRIRNAYMRTRKDVSMSSSKFKVAIAEVLKREGYIENYQVSKEKIPVLTIMLKYFRGRAVVSSIKRVSSPGLRQYKSADDLPRVCGGLGTAIITTNMGVMTDKEARQKRLGGEIVCFVD